MHKRRVMRLTYTITSVGLLAGSLLLGCSGSSTTEPDPTPEPDVTQAKSTKSRLPPSASQQAIDTLTANNTDFAFDLLREEQPAENFFYSPHSISIALAMTYAGARGTTKEEMAGALRFAQPDDELHAAFNAVDQALASRGQGAKGADGEPFRLTVANAAWVQDGSSFLPEYLDTLAEQYGAGINLLDFVGNPEGSRVTINDWVSAKTEDRIPELLPEGVINELTRLVLTNAVYFNASWDIPFEEESTTDGAFTSLAGSAVTVPLMYQAEHHSYAEGDGWQAVELDYDGNEVSMLVVLPAAGSLDDFVAGLSSAKLGEISDALGDKLVQLTFPKFEFRSKLSLKPALTALGMPTAFSGDADFSGMNGDGGLMIQDVIHEGYVNVNEAGTEAAAATAVVVGATSVPETVEMKVDRPFVFVIRDKGTGASLFVGLVADPSA